MGSVGFLSDFEFYMAVLGVPSGPIGFVAPLGFKILDSQPDSSDMGPVSIDVHDFRLFQKSWHGFLACYLSCCQPNCPNVGFSSVWVRAKTMRDEILRRIVVLSPREVPSLPISCPFKILTCRSFSTVPPFLRSQSTRKSVH